MKRTLAAILLGLLFVIPVCSVEGSDGAEYTSDMLLVDYGNGNTQWYSIGSNTGATLLEIVSSVLGANSVTYVTVGNTITAVNGQTNTTVKTQDCVWRFYIWDSFAWIYGETDGSALYTGGTVALGFYPLPSIKPAVTPTFGDSWQSYRGNSSNAGISGSSGPVNAASPLEWYMESETGGVYSSILSADGLVYYTTGGDIHGSGTNRKPHLYCVDTVNHEVAWSFSYSINTSGSSSQYEVDTPVIIGDMLIVTSSNRHIYCLDRFEGTVLSELVPEGELAHFAGVFDTYTYSYESTAALSGTILANGPTSAVYDSGALYFNTHDGAMRCYSVSRDSGFTELWKCLPDESVRGCFYFSAPSIVYIDGVRTVISGSYAGYLYCVDANTGENLRTHKFGDLGTYGTGAIKVVPAGGGKAFILCDDGGMSPRTGFTELVDLKTFDILWKVDLFGSTPVVVGDTVYAYLSPALSASESGKPQVWDKNGTKTDAKAGFYALSVTDGHVLWCNPNDASTRGGMVYCDGRLYCADYSTLAEWPVGGALRCFDPDTGDQIWAIKLSPGSSTAYCMSTPTVIDGKIYVGNDDGTLYCISDIPGRIDKETSDIDYQSQGLLHWSWLMLFAAAALTAIVAIVLYRK